MYNFLLTLTSISTENRLYLQCHVYFVCTVPHQIFKLITFMASWNVKVHFFYILCTCFYITHSPKSPSPIWPHYLHIIVILGYTSQNLHNTYTIPLQHRVHWGSFWRPDIGLGMGLPNLGIGDLTGDFKFLILSVGDTPMKNDMSLRDILGKKKKKKKASTSCSRDSRHWDITTLPLYPSGKRILYMSPCVCRFSLIQVMVVLGAWKRKRLNFFKFKFKKVQLPSFLSLQTVCLHISLN